MKNARRSGPLQTARWIDADRHRATRVESRVHVEQRREAAQQQPTRDCEDDDQGDLRDEREALRVDRARFSR